NSARRLIAGREATSYGIEPVGDPAAFYPGRVTIILVPFHQDERLSDDDLPVPAGGPQVLVDPPMPPVGIWQRLTAVGAATADAVAAALPGADGPVRVVSGDCMVALGTLAGVQRAGLDASLVWFDAHADLHTMASSTSGYLGGM